MTSYSLSRISTQLMADTLFILLALLALFKIQQFVKSNDPSPSFLALSALFTGLTIATRYAGIPVLLTGIISVFLKPNLKIFHRFRCAVIYGSLSIIPFGIWMARNWLSEETFLQYGNYGSSISDYLEKFSKLFITYILVLSPDLEWFIYLISTAALLILWRRVRRRQSWQQISSTTGDPTPDSSQHGLPIMLFSMFAMISILVLLFMASSQGTADQLDERMLLPVYVPIVIVVMLLLDILLHRLTLRWKPLDFALICIISTGILGSISLSSRWNVNLTAQALEINAEAQIFERYGFSKNMEIWKYLNNNPIDGQVYSNGHHLLYWFTDIPFGGIIQEDREPGFCISWVQELAQKSPEPSYIIYFTSQWLSLSRHTPPFNSCNIPALESDSTIQSYLKRINETPEAIVYQTVAGSSEGG